MDTLFLIDNKLCMTLRNIGIHSFYFSEMMSIHRFYRRDCAKLDVSIYDKKGTDSISNKVWLFWAQGKDNMPDIVQKCYKSVLLNTKDLDVELLDLKNCSLYVDIPSYIYSKLESNQISLTHFSDILRFNLLKKYGGYWIDATVLVTQPLEISSSLFTIKHTLNKNYISKAKWSGFLWRMPKEHPLACFMVDYLNSYWMRYNHLLNYLLIDHVIEVFYEKNMSFREEIDHMPISNPDLYFFQSNNCEEIFNENTWDTLKSKNQFFKTTWKSTRIGKLSPELLTFYGRILT